MNEEKTLGGSCLCKAIVFTAKTPSKWCAHCHCSMCRKQHGAGYVTWVGMVSDHVTILDHDNQLTWYESSAGAERGFCGRCGASLFFKSKNWAGELHIALAAFDDPIDREPQAHAFYAAHIDWMPVDDTLIFVKS